MLHPVAFIVVFSVLHFFLFREFRNLINRAGFTLDLYLCFITGLILALMLFTVAAGLLKSIYLIVLFPLLLVIPAIQIFLKRENPIGNTAVSFLGIAYISLPLGLLSFLIFPGFPSDHTFNPVVLMGT